MKFASLLKQHSHSKAPESVRPITINCNKKNIIVHMNDLNDYDYENSSPSEHY